MSAGWPYRCTGTIARVRGVTAAAQAAGSSVSVSGSTSTKTGVAPAAMTARPVNAAVIAGTITSSPAPMSSARSSSAIASVPLPTPTAMRAPLAAANSASNASTSGPSTNQPRAITRSIAARDVGGILAGPEIDERDRRWRSQRGDRAPASGT